MSNKQFVLAALRCTALRVQLIREEINTIGVALASEMITPQAAIEWCDVVAPGCLEVVINTSNVSSEAA
jgi:hypothetical protein